MAYVFILYLFCFGGLLCAIDPISPQARMLRSALTAPSLNGSFSQAPQQESAGKYKLSIVEDASKFRRTRKGRASSEAVVKVTDENDKPIAGIVVSFSIPQLAGANFASAALTTTAVTNSAGLATAGLNVTTAVSTNFSISVSASVAGTPLTASIPVNATAAAAASSSGSAAGTAGSGSGGGLSGTMIGVIVGVVAGGAVAAACASGKCGGGDKQPDASCGVPGKPACPQAGIRIGLGSATVIGPGN